MEQPRARYFLAGDVYKRQVLAMYKAKDFDDALAKAEQLVADGGYGHTASLYVNVNEEEKILKHAAAMKTCRILINTPSSHGGIGDIYNFKLTPSLTPVSYTHLWCQIKSTGIIIT